MQTKAVRIHGTNDLRLDTFDLPEIADDEILAAVVSDSVCMSTHKAAMQGSSHKRVPDDVAENPTIVSHEFCGVIEKVGEKWKDKFAPGEKFASSPHTTMAAVSTRRLQLPLLRRRRDARHHPARDA